MLSSKSVSKKVIFILMSLVLAVSVAAVLPSGSFEANAASKKSKAIKAYKSFLVKERKKKETYMYNGEYTIEKFSLIYLDNNSVPELVTAKGSNYTVYTYKNGKVKKTDIDNIYNLDEYFSYYKKTGIYQRVGTGHSGWIPYSYWKLSGTKSKSKLCKEVAMGSSSDPNDYPPGKYYKNPKRVSKKTFKAALKKLTKGRKLSTAKFHKNSKSNRKKYCK